MKLLHGILTVTVIAAAGACSGAEREKAYVGYVEAEYVYVAAPEAGWLEQLTVREGDEVNAGDVLFELDKDQQAALHAEAAGRLQQADAQARDIATGARREEIAALEAQLEEAKALLTLAKAERDRWMPLVAEGNASRARGDQVTSDYNAASARVRAAEEAIDIAELAGRAAAREAAEAAKASAESALAQAEWRLGQRTVAAQVGGRVEEIFHRAGEFVNAGSTVVALLPTDALKVRFFVPQAELDGFEPGAVVNVKADSRGDVISATIFHVAQEAEFTPPVIYSSEAREKLVFLVEARLASGARLRPGLPVDVTAP